MMIQLMRSPLADQEDVHDPAAGYHLTHGHEQSRHLRCCSGGWESDSDLHGSTIRGVLHRIDVQQHVVDCYMWCDERFSLHYSNACMYNGGGQVTF
jgi:hypothetical protein